MKGRIATRNGQPAYMAAPPRLRASHIQRPTQPMEQPRRSIWQLLMPRSEGRK